MAATLEATFGLPPHPARPTLILAPMAGYSDAPMRLISQQHGAELTFTEMTSARGLLHDSDKSWQLLRRLPAEKNTVAHLYGSEPEILAEATARITAKTSFSGIDLNCGCPVRKVTASGSGAALIRSPELIHRILTAMRAATHLPLTLKTRPGAHPGDGQRIFEILAAAAEAGANALILHARFTSQGHGGSPHLELLAEVKARARIPIIGNGGINNAYDGWRMFRESAVDGLMVARGALGNPWIFSDLRELFSCGSPPSHPNYPGERPRRSLAQIEGALAEHLEHLTHLPQSSEQQLVSVFRCHLFRYLHGLRGSSWLRGHLTQLTTLDEVKEAVGACLAREAEKRPPHI